jgi:hypothetical protein
MDGGAIVKLHGEDSDGSTKECSICLEEAVEGEDIKVLFCKHWFHSNCISMWVRYKADESCPLCKRLG